ncbi:hypothetical protein HK096_004482, partial [Nowakowskiella sp. JEL0078]
MLPGPRLEKNSDIEKAKQLQMVLTMLKMSRPEEVAFDAYHLRRAAVAVDLFLSVAEVAWIESSGLVGQIFVERVWNFHRLTARQHLVTNFHNTGVEMYDTFSVDMLLSCSIPHKLYIQFAALWWLEVLQWSRIAPGFLLMNSSFCVNALAALGQDARKNVRKWAEMSMKGEPGKIPLPLFPKGAIFISPSNPKIEPQHLPPTSSTHHTLYPKCRLVPKDSVLHIVKIGPFCNNVVNDDMEIVFGDQIMPLLFSGDLPYLLSAAACSASYQIPDHPGDASVFPYPIDNEDKNIDFVAISHCWPIHRPSEIEFNNNEEPLLGTESKMKLGSWKLYSSLRGNIEEAIDVAVLLQSYIWMDVLCINQENSKDKMNGVNLMHKVYNGKCVVLEAGGTQVPMTPDDNEFEEVRRIIKGRWMERMWTLQEAILPKSLLFHNTTRRTVVSYETVLTIAEKWNKHAYMESEFSGSGLLRKHLYRLLHLRDQRGSVGNVLTEAHERYCSVPHDKMYSLCGVFTKLLQHPIHTSGYEINDEEGRKEIWEQLVEGMPDWLGFEEKGMDRTGRSWIPKNAMPLHIQPMVSRVHATISNKDSLLYLTDVIILPLIKRFPPSVGVHNQMENFGVSRGYLLDYINVTSDLKGPCLWRTEALTESTKLAEIIPNIYGWRISEMKNYEKGFDGRFSSWVVAGKKGTKLAFMVHDWGETTHLLLLPNSDLQESGGWGGTVILVQILPGDDDCRKFCRT